MWLPHLQYLPLPHDHGLHHGDTDATLNSLSANGVEGQINSNECHGECIARCTIYYVLIKN